MLIEDKMNLKLIGWRTALLLSNQPEQVWSWMTWKKGYFGNRYVPSVADLLADTSLPHSSKFLIADNTRWGSTAFVPATCILSCQIHLDLVKVQLRFPILRSWEIISQKVAFHIYPMKSNKKKDKVEIIEKGRNSDKTEILKWDRLHNYWIKNKPHY